MSSLKHRLPGEGAAQPENGFLRLLDTVLAAAQWALASAALAVVLHLTSRCLS